MVVSCRLYERVSPESVRYEYASYFPGIREREGASELESACVARWWTGTMLLVLAHAKYSAQFEPDQVSAGLA
jgi:hypothetical protein